ncbi:ATP-dependent DNA helicase Q-like SIM [Dendronephthya gigantea]|uniref:ATP-dependent DNA helicase Q-like SIM n=1 Tax=Dendronephthya gigantea TaxID=151771 RepID=UPI00106A521A|nr:ATP-dependent DNA helicase Q-like SIM [Dendronephthya gigantea]
MCVLPTGYGKSLIFHLLPMLLFAKYNLRNDMFQIWRRVWRSSKDISTAGVINSITIVVSPLNSLMSDQISRLTQSSGIQAAIIDIKELRKEHKDSSSDESMDDDDDFNVDIDFNFCEKRKLLDGGYQIVFAHPETLISSKYGRELLLSQTYQENVVGIVIDEAHCIVDWGPDFRTDYAKLGVVCAMFPDVPVLTMTATANRTDIECIKDSLGLKNCKHIVANPDRKNIFYQKIFRTGQDVDAIQSILAPIARALLHQKIDHPLTIIYIPLRICGFAYKLFEHILGNEQYFPLGAASIPSNRLFAQFHAPQTSQMKEEILKQLCSKECIVRVVFATIAIGMGVDIRDIRQIIHIGPPSSVKEYFQETGRAGRDGKPSTALLYYNNRDIANNRVGMQDDMRAYCMSNNACLRNLLLKSLDYKQDVVFKPLHLCCGVCEKDCDCPMCLQLLTGIEKL